MLLERLLEQIIWNKQRKRFKYVGKGGHLGRESKIVHPECISIGDNFVAGRGIKLQVWKEFNGIKMRMEPEMVIGSNVAIMDRCQLSCAKAVYIGEGTLLGENVFVTDNYHGKGEGEELKIPPHKRRLYVKGPVRIGKNVWIGRNVCIMPGVSIGDGVTIGANAVVTKDIPEFSVAVGVPAKVVRQIDSEKRGG